MTYIDYLMNNQNYVTAPFFTAIYGDPHATSMYVQKMIIFSSDHCRQSITNVLYIYKAGLLI
jgi:hypothetical protein